MITESRGLSGQRGLERASHRGARLLDVDWSRAGAELDPATRLRAHRLWVARMRDEQRAVAALSRLLDDMAGDGAPADVLAAGARVVDDEARHVEICGRLATALDGRVPALAGVELPPRSRAGAPVRIAKAVVSLLCVGETLSMHMLRAARDEASDPIIATVLEHLLADESIHSRFGWWWLDVTAPRLSTDVVVAVEAMLPRLFDDLARGLGHGAPAPPLTPGAPSAPVRARAFERAMREVIVPRLEQRGIGASEHWSAIEDRRAA
jgi:hypothetical protein